MAATNSGQTALTIRARITLRPVLVSGENAPFATAYVTTDVRSAPSLVTVGPRTGSSELEFTVEFSVYASADQVGMDTAICVQTFCSIANHKKEPCNHRCGFATFSFRRILEQPGAVVFTEPMRDAGQQMGPRGVAVLGQLSGTLLQALRGAPRAVSAPFDIVDAWSAEGQSLAGECAAINEYRAECRTALCDRRPTSDEVTMYLLPDYVQSVGTIGPSCAFLLADAPPLASEDYYLNALRGSLRRQPWAAWNDDGTEVRILGDAALLRRFLDTKQTTVDEAGSVLIHVAMQMAIAYPYLFDTSISRDGKRLVGSDEFSRILRIVRCSDCEDCSCEACMVLWDILIAASAPGGRWRSEAVARLQAVRRLYVATVTLKSVTRPAESSTVTTTTSKSRQPTLAAHACCDLVPLHLLRRMLAADPSATQHSRAAVAALDAIATERGSSSPYAQPPTRVVVGEGTGIVLSYVRPQHVYQPWAKAAAKRLLKGVLPNARIVSCENLAVDSAFYKYTVSALVHDTIISGAARDVARRSGDAWILPQVVYHWVEGSGGTARPQATKGCPHAAYVVGAAGVTAVAAPPVPARIMDVAIGCAKFEHPIPPLRYPTGPETTARAAAATAMAQSLGVPIVASAGASTRTAATVVACVSLADVTDTALRDLVARVGSSGSVAAFAASFSAVADDVGIATFHLTFQDDGGWF
jgi:hypothetical protein